MAIRLVVSIGLALGLFPVVDLLCRTYGATTSVVVAVCTLYALESATVTIGVGLTKAFPKERYRRLLRALVVLVVASSFGVIGSLLVGTLTVGCYMVTSLAVALTANRVYSVSIDRLANAYVYVATSMLYVVCTFIGWQSQFGVHKVSYVVAYWLFCVAFAVVMNRSNLERVIGRRAQNLGSIPQDIFRYNTRLTLLICLVPVPMLLLSDVVGTSLYGLLVSSLRGIVHVGSWLSSLFAKDETPIETVENTTETTYQPYYSDGSSAIWDVFTVVCAVALLYWLYRNYGALLDRLRDYLATLKAKLLHHEGTPTPSSEGITQLEDYTDYVKEVPKGYGVKSFKRDYKAYLHMDTTTDTLAFGFETLTRGLQLLGYEVSQHDTVTDVDNTFPMEGFHLEYLAVRYGDVQPTQEVRSHLDNLLKSVRRRL